MILLVACSYLHVELCSFIIVVDLGEKSNKAEAFHALIAFIVSFLAALIGLHFQVLSVSPLETHFATVLLFIMAAIVYSIAYMEIKLQPQGAEYLLLFRFICLVSGIISVELLISIIISPFWLFMFLYYTANLIFNAVPSLLKKIYQLVCQIYDWLLQIFQSGAFHAFSSREREENDNQAVETV
ncbi:hypothetical protein RGQ29_004085 [Quercus rubra]|uniref:Transmembrane protein n=1 Tax=Quercus rubra TaxID=3512 RepID=A0AAN7I8F4_QUERU|nr:hypothetical protein RGQ29_004085 [Quercus rubra]